MKNGRYVAFRLSEWHIYILDLFAHHLKMNRTDAIRRLIEETNERNHFDLIEPEIFRKSKEKDHDRKNRCRNTKGRS